MRKHPLHLKSTADVGSQIQKVTVWKFQEISTIGFWTLRNWRIPVEEYVDCSVVTWKTILVAYRANPLRCIQYRPNRNLILIIQQDTFIHCTLICSYKQPPRYKTNHFSISNFYYNKVILTINMQLKTLLYALLSFQSIKVTQVAIIHSVSFLNLCSPNFLSLPHSFSLSLVLKYE